VVSDFVRRVVRPRGELPPINPKDVSVLRFRWRLIRFVRASSRARKEGRKKSPPHVPSTCSHIAHLKGHTHPTALRTHHPPPSISHFTRRSSPSPSPSPSPTAILLLLRILILILILARNLHFGPSLESTYPSNLLQTSGATVRPPFGPQFPASQNFARLPGVVHRPFTSNPAERIDDGENLSEELSISFLVSPSSQVVHTSDTDVVHLSIPTRLGPRIAG
ncbi:hypothetical protein MMC17_000209, partial [Xylographa soralifera]|nr:hypothetical protein [Xylographa soralifera]